VAKHTIQVTVDPGSIRVKPDSLRMTSADEVQWSGGNARRFRIVFDGAGPFDQADLAHDAAIQAQKPRRKGRFKYSVVAADDPSNRLDPEVIVEDPPTDPHHP
jgi:hypothetical protein